MPHYIAIIEDAGPDKAIGVWFPDLPGCFSAGDDMDEALQNAPEAISLYAELLAREQKSLPQPRKLAAIRTTLRSLRTCVTTFWRSSPCRNRLTRQNSNSVCVG